MAEADLPVSRGLVFSKGDLPELQPFLIFADIMAPLDGARDAILALQRPQPVDDPSRNLAALAFIARAAADAHRRAAKRLDELAEEADRRLRPDF